MGRAAAPRPTVSIAAAANLTFVLDALDAAFARVAPDVTVTTTFGSSGNLYAQISNGAPFDVFLSADTLYARRLANAGYADPATLRVFATGRLVLWTTRPGLDLRDIAAAARSPHVRKIAIAQPTTAPYGQAAQQVLRALGVLDEVTPKLVIGQNIAQTAQFIETGNADAGFVALSLVKTPRLQNKGRWLEVPPNLYAGVSLDHACILAQHGAANDAARRYLAFLFSEPAKQILEQAGYTVSR